MSDPESTVNPIIDSLIKYFSENFSDNNPLSSSTELKALGVDSFSLLETILFLERSFGTRFPLELLTAENVQTIGSLGVCYGSVCSKA